MTLFPVGNCKIDQNIAILWILDSLLLEDHERIPHRMVAMEIVYRVMQIVIMLKIYKSHREFTRGKRAFRHKTVLEIRRCPLDTKMTSDTRMDWRVNKAQRLFDHRNGLLNSGFRLDQD